MGVFLVCGLFLLWWIGSRSSRLLDCLFDVCISVIGVVSVFLLVVVVCSVVLCWVGLDVMFSLMVLWLCLIGLM